MKTCYLCNAPLTDTNKSLEHIIPNALGGKLKSKEILCNVCNNAMSDIDNNLIKNFKFLTIQSGIKRDRDNTIQSVPIEVDGMKAVLKTGNEISTRFKPKFIRDENGEAVQFCGAFTDEKDANAFLKQAQTFLNKKSKGKKYYTIDDIKATTKIETKKPFLIVNEITFGSYDIYLGYLKILLGFCALKDKIQYIDSNIITFFKERNVNNIEAIATFCSNTKFLENSRLCHRIYIIAKQNERKLFGIVSLYGKFCCIFVLNDNYIDKDFIEYYSYDILNNKKINESLEINNLDLTQYFHHEKAYCLKAIGHSIVNCFNYYMKFFTSQSSENIDLLIPQLFEFIATIEIECLNLKDLKDYLKQAILKARKQNFLLFLKDADIDKIVDDILIDETYLFYRQKYDMFQQTVNVLENEHFEVMKCLRSCMSESDIRKFIALAILSDDNIWVKLLL